MPETTAIPATVEVAGEAMIDAIAQLHSLSSRLDIIAGRVETKFGGEALLISCELFEAAFGKAINEEELSELVDRRSDALTAEWAAGLFRHVAELEGRPLRGLELQARRGEE